MVEMMIDLWWWRTPCSYSSSFLGVRHCTVHTLYRSLCCPTVPMLRIHFKTRIHLSSMFSFLFWQAPVCLFALLIAFLPSMVYGEKQAKAARQAKRQGARRYPFGGCHTSWKGKNVRFIQINETICPSTHPTHSPSRRFSLCVWNEKSKSSSNRSMEDNEDQDSPTSNENDNNNNNGSDSTAPVGGGHCGRPLEPQTISNILLFYEDDDDDGSSLLSIRSTALTVGLEQDELLLLQHLLHHPSPPPSLIWMVSLEKLEKMTKKENNDDVDGCFFVYTGHVSSALVLVVVFVVWWFKIRYCLLQMTTLQR